MINNISEKNKSSFFKKIFLAIFASVLIATGGYFYYQKNYASGIYKYSPKRDRAAILNLFEENWDFLVPDRNYSAENTLDLKRASYDHNYDGKLQIKVYKIARDTVGFVAYYKMKFYHGHVLFLCVAERYRNKGYARKLLQYAQNDLKSQGCVKVTMWTYPWNEKSRALYKSDGFREIEVSDKQVSLEKEL